MQNTNFQSSLSVEEPLLLTRNESILASFDDAKEASIFRSEDMAYGELVIEVEATYKCIAALGEASRVQFVNLNAHGHHFRQRFAQEVRECDAVERQINRIEEAITKTGIPISSEYGEVSVLTPKGFKRLAASLEEYEMELNSDKASIRSLKESRVDLVQFHGVLELFEQYCEEVMSAAEQSKGRGRRRLASVSSNLIPSGDNPAAQFGYITGVIERKKCNSFESVLFRVGRGNIFVRTVPMAEEVDDSEDHHIVSNVFMAFFHGESLKAKVEAISKAYCAKLYNCPTKREERQKLVKELVIRHADLDEVIKNALEFHELMMQKLAKSTRTWKIQVHKVKSIYHTMNMFTMDDNHRYLIGQCWIPAAHFHHVDIALTAAIGNADSGQYIFTQLPTPRGVHVHIPTYFQTNKLTKCFQNIVHAFSIAKYKEVNPALYTTITFPFLFAVMFGDFGHGVIMACFGAWMCIKEAKLKKAAANAESFNMIFGGRYVILLMGIFSIYAGFLYNDCFAKAVNIFGSTWQTNFTESQLKRHEKFLVDPNKMMKQERNISDTWVAKNLDSTFGVNLDQLGFSWLNDMYFPYQFGIDPVWHASDNRINFINSMKMKLSIILGVAQMMFGIFLSLLNHFYYKHYVNIFCEFIPQILFITCLFLYMDALIVFKWIYFNASTANSAPSVLITLINMCLMKYSEDTPSEYFVYHNLMYLQYAFLAVVVISVPWMLIIKPLYLRSQVQAGKASSDIAEVMSAEPSISDEDDIEAGQKGREGQAGEPTMIQEIDEEYNFSPEDVKAEREDDRSGDSVSQDEGEQAYLEEGDAEEFRVEDIEERPNEIVDPEYERIRMKRRETIASVVSSRAAKAPSVLEQKQSEVQHADVEFNFVDVFIHQAIHTIEYVLGLISHTASYLRLWALSLAHAELSTVLWEMIFHRGLAMSNGLGYLGCIPVFITFVPWACLTLAILVMMEGMSAFLHALRLHWVEFQSKFYLGGGHPFQPFDFKAAYSLIGHK